MIQDSSRGACTDVRTEPVINTGLAPGGTGMKNGSRKGSWPATPVLVRAKAMGGWFPMLFLTLLLNGCFASRPLENTDFRPIESLHDLAGTYRNLGEGDEKSGPRYLSAIIWPKSADLDHEA